MKIYRLFLLAALACAGFAQARPLVIEQPQQLPFIWDRVALYGDDLLSVVKTFETPETAPSPWHYSANLYRRNSAGQWLLAQTLENWSPTREIQRPPVAMNASILAFTVPVGLRIFERTAQGWTNASTIYQRPWPGGGYLALSGDTILTTPTNEQGCSGYAMTLNRDASGHWVQSGTLNMPAPTCVRGVAIDGNRAIVRSQAGLEDPPFVRIFERTSGGGWDVAAEYSVVESNAQYYGQSIAIHGDLAIVSGVDHGAYLYRRGTSGWAFSGYFPAPDAGGSDQDGSIEITDRYLLRVNGMLNRSTGAGYLYRERPDHSFELLADLVGTRETGLSLASIDGSGGDRVIGLGGDFGNQPLDFTLPTSFAVPPMRQEVFETDASPWTPLPGSQFDVMPAFDGVGHVYRQSSLLGDAGAVHSADMTDQSVSADIRITAFSGADRWVGLMTRYTDESNYYYVTLRDTNRIVLKRMLNGVYTDLQSAALDVAPGQTYRITLESSGTHHNVFVDGRKIFFLAYDASLTHGHPGLRMYKAAADFDNVVITPGPVSNRVWADPTTLGGTWGGTPTSPTQSSTAGDALRTTGVASEDAAVQAIVTVSSFGATGSPWAGLLLRYQDPDNYYYLTARKSNELSLRRLVNGSIVVLDTVPLSVTPGAPFALRLEAIGDRLRVYVNDVLRIERTGASIVAGKVGLVTYRTAAQFEGYTAYEP